MYSVGIYINCKLHIVIDDERHLVLVTDSLYLKSLLILILKPCIRICTKDILVTYLNHRGTALYSKLHMLGKPRSVQPLPVCYSVEL